MKFRVRPQFLFNNFVLIQREKGNLIWSFLLYIVVQTILRHFEHFWTILCMRWSEKLMSGASINKIIKPHLEIRFQMKWLNKYVIESHSPPMEGNLPSVLYPSISQVDSRRNNTLFHHQMKRLESNIMLNSNF